MKKRPVPVQDPARTGCVAVIAAGSCKGCGYCIAVCPVRCLAYSADLNKRGVRYATVLTGARCIGCGACYLMCPETCIVITQASPDVPEK